MTATVPEAALEVWVPGRPAAQGSKRHVGGGRLIEQSKAVAPWRTHVAWNLSQAWAGPPIDGAVSVSLEFLMPRPGSAPKRSTPPAIKRPDLDKLIRAVFDAVTTAGVWRDDSQVVSLVASKRLCWPGEAPGCRIVVRGV